MFDDARKRALTEKVVRLTRKKKLEDYPKVLAPLLNHPKTGLEAASVVWGVFHRPELVRKPVEAALKPYEKGGHPEEACDLVADMCERGSFYLPAVEALIASTDDWDTLWGAACALEAMRAEAAPALDTLLKLLAHESGRVAGAAASSVGHLGVRALPSLIRILETGAPRTKEFACDALGRLGPAAKKALPLLVRLREDPACEGDFRAWQTLAVAEISLDKKFAPALLVLSDGKDIDLELRAKAALEKMDFSRVEVIEAVRRELAETGDSDPERAAALRMVLRRFRR